MTTHDRLISIVEDDASLRDAMARLIRSLGYRVDAYANAEQFLDAGAGRGTDCVVTDIQMPGLSGIELKLRLAARGDLTPVIMVTARSEPELHERAMASGAYCLLKKPFTAEALIECLDHALGA
jgi:FixJ family two-component response regulator